MKSPNETLAEMLKHQKISIFELSEAIDLPIIWINLILNGKCTMNKNIDLKLHDALGTEIGYWTNLQEKYAGNKQELLNNLK